MLPILVYSVVQYITNTVYYSRIQYTKVQVHYITIEITRQYNILNFSILECNKNTTTATSDTLSLQTNSSSSSTYPSEGAGQSCVPPPGEEHVGQGEGVPVHHQRHHSVARLTQITYQQQPLQ